MMATQGGAMLLVSKSFRPTRPTVGFRVWHFMGFPHRCCVRRVKLRWLPVHKRIGALDAALMMLMIGNSPPIHPGPPPAAATPQLYAVVGGNSRWIEILPI